MIKDNIKEEEFENKVVPLKSKSKGGSLKLSPEKFCRAYKQTIAINTVRASIQNLSAQGMQLEEENKLILEVSGLPEKVDKFTFNEKDCTISWE